MAAHKIAGHLGNSVAVRAQRYAHRTADMRDQETVSVEQAILAARRSQTGR
jgi:hypothetical protein